MGEHWEKQVGGAFVASILAHVLVAVLLIALPIAVPPLERDEVEQEFEIVVEEIEAPEPEPEVVPEPEPEPEVVPEPEPEPETPQPEPPRPEREVAPAPGALAPDRTAIPEITPEPPQTTGGAPGAPSEPGPAPRRSAEEMRILLDPARVARGSFTIDPGEGPSQRRAPQAGTSVAVGPGRMSEAEAEAMHSGSMREQAMARPWLSRTELTARPRPDGTYVYAGHAFNATIHPDGSVSYDDRPGVQTDGFSTSGTFDLGDVFMRAAGGDPYAAERMRFEEDNEELIARLEGQWRREHMDDALRRIPGQLTQIWSRSSRPPERRRRQIFEMWEETDEGEAGLEARRRIEAWVREQLPAGGESAFTPEELRALNASHTHPYRFNPYR